MRNDVIYVFGTLKFTPLEFETLGREDGVIISSRLKFTPLEFETVGYEPH